MTVSDERRPLIYGEVLFDCFPDGKAVLGGAPFNVAWHLQAFGLNPLFVSRVGKDELGAQIRTAMQEWGMDTRGLQIDPDHPTGTVQVRLEAGEPQFHILPEQAYDYIDATRLPVLPAAGLLYHGSLIQRAPQSAASLETLRRETGAPVFLDVNLRDPWWEHETVHASLQAARWIKLNQAELERLVPGASLHHRARGLHEKTRAEWIVVTRGERGTLAFTADGHVEEVVPEETITVVDTVGAGDAFASVMILGLWHGWPLATSLQRAQAFASAIVGRRGATVRERDFYQPFIEAWELA